MEFVNIVRLSCTARWADEPRYQLLLAQCTCCAFAIYRCCAAQTSLRSS